MKNSVKNRVLNPLLIAQVVAHLSLIPMLIWAEWRHWLIALAIYFLTGCLGMSMTYHRLLAHNSWKAPRWFEWFGTLCATLGLTGSSLAWCSVHREHHQKADTEADPHSPLHRKWYEVQFFSMFYPPKMKFMSQKLTDPFHRFLHNYYFPINCGYSGFLFFLDPFAVIYAHLFPAAILWNSGSAVNTWGHLFGYRNFKTNDSSKNNLILALLSWGEGWHNNHHYQSEKPYFGTKWYEVDIAGALILFILWIKGFFLKASAK